MANRATHRPTDALAMQMRRRELIKPPSKSHPAKQPVLPPPLLSPGASAKVYGGSGIGLILSLFFLPK